MNKQFKAALTALVLLAGASVLAQDYEKEITRVVVEVDVAVNGTTIQRTTGAGGFVIEGYVYPSGTLDASNGINPDGTPEFPDLVIGHWTCQGFTFLTRPQTGSSPIVAGSNTKQTFELDLDNFGNDMIFTQGFEIQNFGAVDTRAVTGGTGQYIGRDMLQLQVLGGINATGGPNYINRIVQVYRIAFKNKNGEAENNQ